MPYYDIILLYPIMLVTCSDANQTHLVLPHFKTLNGHIHNVIIMQYQYDIPYIIMRHPDIMVSYSDITVPTLSLNRFNVLYVLGRYEQMLNLLL